MSARHPELEATWWPADALSREVEGALLYTPCGRGRWLVAQAAWTSLRVGADPVQQNLAQAREHAALQGVGCGFVPATSWALPFADACFARVVDVGGLQTAPDLDEALVELLRVVAHDGELVLVWGGGADEGAVQWPVCRSLSQELIREQVEAFGGEVLLAGQQDGLEFAIVARHGQIR